MIEPAIYIKTSDCGDLISPDLHDSKLTAIRLNQGSVEFIFKLVSGELIVAILDGVFRMCCNNFLEENIVLDMSIVTKRLVEKSELEQLLTPPKAQLDKHDSYIKEVQDKILQGGLSFVELNNSYGCQAYILCNSVKFARL